MERLLKRLTVMFAMGVLALTMGSTAQAQYIVIDAPGDSTVIDTSYQPPSGYLVPPLEDLRLATTDGSRSTPSLTISQLICGPVVCAYVDVIGSNGFTVGGLNADSFCVKQDGVTIPSFTVQQLTADSCITSVCFVVDLSLSMLDDNRLDSAKAAMHRYVNNMDAFDRAAIVPYSNCIGTVTNFTSNKTTLHNAINALAATGFTACYDGIYKGVDLTRFELGSKAVIAFTDGLENRSQYCSQPPDGVSDGTYADDSTLICNLASTGGVPIYTFNLGPIDYTWYNPIALQKFANATGGFWSHAPNSASVDSVYTLIKQRLCSRYYICYDNPDTVQNGETHATIICKKDGANCTPCDTAYCTETDPPDPQRNPPTIDLSDTCQIPTNNLTICTYVYDDDTPPGSLVVTLFYKINGDASYSSTAMTYNPNDSLFCATLPPSLLQCKTTLQYYTTASDGQTTVSDPAVNPQGNPYVIQICPNLPPVADAGRDSVLFQCSPAPICITAACSDPDGNLSTCQLVSGPGTYNGSAICFTPVTSGAYTLVLKATDACGATDYDTSVVTVTLNQAPVANAGADSTVYQCGAAPVCFPASCSDPDGNLSTCQLISGPGTYNGTDICFTPPSSGSYTFVLQATDACGATDLDTAVVTVTQNQPPVADAGRDSTLSQCTPAQICWPAACSDPNGNLSTCQLISGPGTYNGTNICFTPAASGTYTFILQATDACGATDLDTAVINVTLNVAPVADAGSDSTVTQCSPAQICWPASCSDPNGNLSTCQLISGPGTYNGTDICFTPASSGTYTFILQATDACGATDLDTAVINVTLNVAPVADAGRDSTLFQCAPAQICWPASCTDANGNLSTCQLVSGPGTYNGTDICFTPAASGTYTFVLQATDACGATDLDTAVVNVTLNVAPVADAGRDSTLFQCTPAQICWPAACTDANSNLSTCQLISGPGTYNGTNICFTPAASGTYTFILQATDACGATDLDTAVINVTLNQAPIADAGSDSTVTQCSPAQICWPASCSDPNGNLSTCQLISGPGTYNGTDICFTPASSGTYTFILQATDACGATDLDTAVINVTLNVAPVADAGRDSTLFQCAPAQICWPASCTDANGNLSTCQLVSGPGTYNGTDICFTPVSSGTYTFVLQATDACGATDLDTAVVNVTMNLAPVADAGRDSALFQCAPAQICWPAACSDPNGNLSTCQLISGPGTYNGTNICFTPAASGTYTFILQATDACGATDLDTAVINVTLNQAPVADAGRDSTLFQCAPAQICWPASCNDPDGNLSTCQLVSGPGTYNGTNICFTPAGAGVYTFVLLATDACGATDYDTAVVTVTLNQPPVATLGNDTTAFQCASEQICIPASCSDPDGNLSTCQLVSGPGTYNGTNICFTPAGAGIYTFVVQATDACGAVDYDTAVVTVAVNNPPVADAGRDSTLFQCTPEQICYSAGCSDADGNLTNCELISGPGALIWGAICFTPAASGTYTFIVKATDACGATDYDTSVVNVTLNVAPVADAGRDSTLFQCTPAQICWPASCSDPNGNLSSCQLISGPGTYNGTDICFTPAASGVYTFVLEATDACGATDLDTAVISVTLNVAPVADAGRDSTLFQCVPTQICWPASCSDPNSNLSTCQLVSGPGTYNGTNICFTPAGAGVFTFVLQATDACGAIDLDTAVVTVTANAAPVASCHGDTTIFACNLNQICLGGFGATDPNGNLSGTTVTGGTLNGSQVCFTPVAGPNMIRLIATDACGLADTCQTVVTIVLNAAPVANAGSDQNLSCQSPSQQICWPASGSDPNGNLSDCQLLSGPGTYNGTNICFTPAASGTFTFVLKATDACGATDFDTAVVTVRLNTAPTASVDPTDTTLFCTQTGAAQLCVPFSYSDAEGNVQSVSVAPAPASLNWANGSGSFCFTPGGSDAQYAFTVTVTDSCGQSAQTSHTRWVGFIDCDTATCFIVKAEKTHNTLQGHYEYVSVTIEGSGQDFGGYDFLMSYDNTGLSFMQAEPGVMLTNCGWEYFTYRYGVPSNCSGPCPSGMVRVVAIADVSNGANHPSCFGPALPSPVELFRLKFFVSNDRTFECQYLPIKFFWLDCGDNAVSSVTGDTLWIEKRILSFEGNILWDEFDDVGYPNSARPFGFGAQDICMLGEKYEPIRCIEFWEGGIDVVCADSIDAPGDINLNGIAYEIADAVLFTNYFLYGIDALDPNPQRREAQIAASDVNRDGTPLSVGDLVYLVRVIVGDALPLSKLTPFASTVTVHQDGELLVTESSSRVGAMLLTFAVGDSYRLENLTNLTLLQAADKGMLKALIYDISTAALEAGVNRIARVEGDIRLVSAEAADYSGNMLTSTLAKSIMPTAFSLGQNYPNPFNPETVIEFALPTAADVTISVFNAAGQKVATVLNGMLPAGRHQVRWNAEDSGGNRVSSGVYFYKLETSGFTATKKMLLVK